MGTIVSYLNHSSILIEHDNYFLLADPWHSHPAFGSWLPLPPLPIHPAYLASIKNLVILVSHGHDDHFDDQFLSLFDEKTEVVTSDFSAPGVRNRLGRAGFQKIHEVGTEGVTIGPFTIKSFREHSISLDDAAYSIRTPGALIVHANDLSIPLSDGHIAEINGERSLLPDPNKSLYMSQANTGNGFPLAYKNFSLEKRLDLLAEKSRGMLDAALENSRKSGIQKFAGYAGNTMILKKEEDDYSKVMSSPTPEGYRRLKSPGVGEQVRILDMEPGQAFDFDRDEIVRIPIPLYCREKIVRKTEEYYRRYEVAQKTDTHFSQPVIDSEVFLERVKKFLEDFNQFVDYKSQKDDFRKSILGKKFRITIKDLQAGFTIQFGEGLIDSTDFNEHMIVGSEIFQKVLLGQSWFENLHTGYMADFERKPEEMDNRDIIMYVCMFSYYYKHRILGLKSVDESLRFFESPQDDSRI